jgi:ParB family chromosome partitioning protein
MASCIASPAPCEPIAAKPTTEHRPLEWFKPDETELARHDDPEKIRQQGENMLVNGQLQAVGATEDGRMIWGHGRLLSAISARIKTLEVKLFPASISNTQFKLIRASENLQRKDLTGYQKFLLCSELLRDNPTWQLKDLAEKHLHLDPSMVTRLLAPSKCIEAAQNALREDKIGISDCYEFSLVSPDRQAELLLMKLSGASRNAIKDARRKSRNGEEGLVKLSRVKIAMPQGSTVVISGNSLSMPEVVELLSETLKEARKAAEQYDVKTFQNMMKDKARKN